MPFYPGLKKLENKKRAVEKILGLRAQIKSEIPTKTIRSTVLIATWNIRDFDSNKFKHGPRLPETFFYIAEIISAFDVVALQEINENLGALEAVMRILGANWDYIVTDVTEGRSGNQERIAFVFDKRKILFGNVAGEIVLPESRLILNGKQFARTPFIVSFQAGWFRFNLCAVHLFYGADSGEKLERRIREIESIANFLAHRAKKSKENYILLGDFNIVSPEHETMKSLKLNDFIIPQQLSKLPSNMDQTKHYDQIAFMTKKGELEIGDSRNNAGVFNFYNSLFCSIGSDFANYCSDMEAIRSEFLEMSGTEKQKYYADTWRTFQMSDHFPMFIELKIDFTDRYLKHIVDGDFT